MTVKDILSLACDFVGEKEIKAKIFLENPTYTAREQEKLDLMIRCLNLVNQEIASDYLPFLFEENVDANGGVISFDGLEKSVIAVYQVKNRFGFPIRFKNYPNYVEVFGSAKKIVYSYLPDEVGLDDEIEKFNGLSERVYAYGVASEFLLIQGMGSDAEIWEERYKESLFILSSRKGEHRLPRRRWL